MEQNSFHFLVDFSSSFFFIITLFSCAFRILSHSEHRNERIKIHFICAHKIFKRIHTVIMHAMWKLEGERKRRKKKKIVEKNNNCKNRK